MTCIAWDGKTLAADKMCSSFSVGTTVTKIRRVAGVLVGSSGSASLDASMCAWVAGGRKPDEFPAQQQNKDDCSTTLVIEPGGRVLIYQHTVHPVVVEDKFTAIGSGRDFALAAMHLGHSAREAVEVANRLCTSCGMGVDVLEFE